MPLKDPNISIQVDLEDKIKEKTKKITKTNYSPTAVNAGKLAIKTIPSKARAIQAVIDEISDASDRGKFICTITPEFKYKEDIRKYLVKNNYIIACEDKDMTELYVIWIGGKRWSKIYYSNIKDELKLAIEAYKRIKTELNIESESNLNKIGFINPKVDIKDTEDVVVKKLLPFFKKMY